MTIKKILVLFSLVVFVVTTGFSITRDSIDEKNSESKKLPYEKEIKKAKDYYCEGNFAKAEESINVVLSQSIDNEKASELRNKILLS